MFVARAALPSRQGRRVSERRTLTRVSRRHDEHSSSRTNGSFEFPRVIASPLRPHNEGHPMCRRQMGTQGKRRTRPVPLDTPNQETSDESSHDRLCCHFGCRRRQRRPGRSARWMHHIVGAWHLGLPLRRCLTVASLQRGSGAWPRIPTPFGTSPNRLCRYRTGARVNDRSPTQCCEYRNISNPF